MKLVKIFQFFSMIICVVLFFSSNEVQAQKGAKVAVDCSKICYEYGMTGTSFCIGGKGAVSPNSKVTLSDGTNTVEGKSKADGSFGIDRIHQLVAPVGASIVVTVNGQSCKVIVRRPNTCERPKKAGKVGRGGRGTGYNNPKRSATTPNNTDKSKEEKNKEEEEQSKKEKQNESTDIEKDLEKVGKGTIDCSKICYEYGITGTSFCKGSAGAVDPNSKVEISDGKNTVTGESQKDGSFAIVPINNLEAPVGSTVTITVNGKSCKVIVQRPNGCN